MMKIGSSPGTISLELNGVEATRLTNAVWDYLDRNPEDRAEWHFLRGLASVVGTILEEKARGVYREPADFAVSAEDRLVAEESRKVIRRLWRSRRV